MVIPYAVHILPHQKTADNAAVRFLSAVVKDVITKMILWRREFNGIVVKYDGTNWRISVCVLLRGQKYSHSFQSL